MECCYCQTKTEKKKSTGRWSILALYICTGPLNCSCHRPVDKCSPWFKVLDISFILGLFNCPANIQRTNIATGPRSKEIIYTRTIYLF